ncbi:MAG TPA: mechanosensitive ion channel family protein, partial [Phycisphaerales bacterium]|nr:mechanosensitive ion channel family protein [Phycisphaerales bacterium]
DATSAAPAAQPIISRLQPVIEAAQGTRFDPLDIATWRWESVLWGNTLKTWTIAIIIAVVLQAIFWLFRKYAVLGRARTLASRTNSLVDDFVVELLSDLRYWWVATMSVVLASKVLYMGQPIELGGVPVAVSRLHTLAIIVTALQLLLSSRIVVKYAIQALLRRTTHADGTVDETINTSTGVLRALGMFAICTIIVLLALDNLGVKVTPLLTGLGIGGIAIALAAQNILGDLFASFIIIFDKPFVVGDFITVGDKMGTVEKIGIKTSRVRALSGEQLVFGNASLLNSTVQNFKRMQERRVAATYGVTYDTSPDKLRAIPGIIKAAVERHELARFDRCHFKTFNSYSLDFELIYWVKSPDFMVHKDIQHALNIELVEKFAAQEIEFAFPTQVEIVKDFSRPGEEKTTKRG